MSQYWLVTYEWRECGRHSDPDFKRDNQVIEGCPAIWFAQQLNWYRAYEEKARKVAKEYAERGEEVPSSKRVNSTELRFICATPISKKGYDELNGVVG